VVHHRVDSGSALRSRTLHTDLDSMDVLSRVSDLEHGVLVSVLTFAGFTEIVVVANGTLVADSNNSGFTDIAEGSVNFRSGSFSFLSLNDFLHEAASNFHDLAEDLLEVNLDLALLLLSSVDDEELVSFLIFSNMSGNLRIVLSTNDPFVADVGLLSVGVSRLNGGVMGLNSLVVDPEGRDFGVGHVVKLDVDTLVLLLLGLFDLNFLDLFFFNQVFDQRRVFSMREDRFISRLHFADGDLRLVFL